tara:strand:+ start:639 stop:1217 length:579 start_codon:yes stop_codon:yes gene_type:complete
MAERTDCRVFDSPLLQYEDVSPADLIYDDPTRGTSHEVVKLGLGDKGKRWPANIWAHTLMVSIHGACKGNGTANPQASWSVYFGNNSNRNECGLLPDPKHERHTSQSAPLYAAKRAIEIVEDSTFKPLGIETLVIKTHSAYLVESLSRDVWQWEKTNYVNADGETVANRFLVEKLHDMIAESTREVSATQDP